MKRRYLMDNFAKMGIGSDDTVFVHSSFKGLSQVGVTPNDFIDSLGATARNIVFPTFTYGFWDGQPFWIDVTPSDTGILGETLRSRDDSVRSNHPFYSVTASGLDAAIITTLGDRTAFGPGSVWATLYDLNAWLMIIDLRFDQSFTFFHYVEQAKGGVDYRHEKTFTGLVNGVEEDWTMHVRDEGVRTWVEPMGELLINTGAMKRVELGGVQFKLGRAQNVYLAVAHYLRSVPELLHSREEWNR